MSKTNRWFYFNPEDDIMEVTNRQSSAKTHLTDWFTANQDPACIALGLTQWQCNANTFDKLYAAIREWCHGTQKHMEILAQLYLDVYFGHIEMFAYIRENQITKFHMILGDIVSLAKWVVHYHVRLLLIIHSVLRKQLQIQSQLQNWILKHLTTNKLVLWCHCKCLVILVLTQRANPIIVNNSTIIPSRQQRFHELGIGTGH